MPPRREGLSERGSPGPEEASCLLSSRGVTWVINRSIGEISVGHENVANPWKRGVVAASREGRGRRPFSVGFTPRSLLKGRKETIMNIRALAAHIIPTLSCHYSRAPQLHVQLHQRASSP